MYLCINEIIGKHFQLEQDQNANEANGQVPGLPGKACQWANQRNQGKY